VIENIDTGQELKENEIPDYILNPQMDMPEQEIDGHKYIGSLEVPACSLTLPVISQWSYPELKIAPCRYKGSAYLDNMIIAAHNYPSHFGNLKNLQPMDAIVFTDIDGNSFRYQVVEKEVLKSTAIEEMEAGEWDLTLFTCTIGGADRITIRCEKTE
jgi:sortase A